MDRPGGAAQGFVPPGPNLGTVLPLVAEVPRHVILPPSFPRILADPFGQSHFQPEPDGRPRRETNPSGVRQVRATFHLTEMGFSRPPPLKQPPVNLAQGNTSGISLTGGCSS